MSYKINIVPFRQSPRFCGPGALKIALSAFDKDVSEGELARLCGAIQQYGRGTGTEHEGLISAAKAHGMHVFTKDEGTIEDLYYFIETEHLPVLVGWFDRDEDHYSVAVEITDDDVVLADSGPEGPERKIPKDFFKMIWFDFIGPREKEVSWGWYMVMSPEKRDYKIAGGQHH